MALIEWSWIKTLYSARLSYCLSLTNGYGCYLYVWNTCIRVHIKDDCVCRNHQTAFGWFDWIHATTWSLSLPSVTDDFSINESRQSSSLLYRSLDMDESPFCKTTQKQNRFILRDVAFEWEISFCKNEYTIPPLLTRWKGHTHMLLIEILSVSILFIFPIMTCKCYFMKGMAFDMDTVSKPLIVFSLSLSRSLFSVYESVYKMIFTVKFSIKNERFMHHQSTSIWYIDSNYYLRSVRISIEFLMARLKWSSVQ